MQQMNYREELISVRKIANYQESLESACEHSRVNPSLDGLSKIISAALKETCQNREISPQPGSYDNLKKVLRSGPVLLFECLTKDWPDRNLEWADISELEVAGYVLYRSESQLIVLDAGEAMFFFTQVPGRSIGSFIRNFRKRYQTLLDSGESWVIASVADESIDGSHYLDGELHRINAGAPKEVA
jgi:hypothetical protein